MKNLNRIHLGGLRAVEAVGRLGSLKQAAEELGVTLGAVSQQIRKAEDQLGRSLFDRHSKGLRLTETGQEILPLLSRGLAELSNAVRLAEKTEENTLTISVAPVFAGKWLVWELPDFNAKFPKIRLRVESSLNLVTPGLQDVDACIRVGRGPWPDVKADKLIDHRIFPVCSPALAEKLKTPADLAGLPIIRDENAMFSWNDWLNPNGLEETILQDGPTYSDGSLCFDAAIAGQGVFLAWETLASYALKAGQVVTPFKDRYSTGFSYWLITAPNTSPSSQVKAFDSWLRERLGGLA